MAESSKWRAFDLRGLLFGVVGGILVVCIIAFALLAWSFARRVVDPAVDRQLRARVSSAVELIESKIDASVFELELVALSPALSATLETTGGGQGRRDAGPGSPPSGGPAAAGLYLRRVVRDSDFSNLALADRRGNVAAASGSVGSRVFEDDEWWRRVTQVGTGLAPAEVDPATNEVSVRLAVPVRSEAGAVIGVLAGRLDLARLRSRLEEQALGEGGFVQVIDERGRRVFDSRSEGPLSPHAEPAALVVGRRTEMAGPDGERLVGWVEPTQDRRWTVAYWMPEDEAFALLRAARRAVTVLVLIAFITGTVGIGIAGAWVRREIGRPVQVVADAADRVGAGDLRVRIERLGRGEVARLCGAVQGMIDHLSDLVGSVHQASLEAQFGSQEIAAAVGQLSAAAEEMSATLALLTGEAARHSDTVQRTNAEMATLSSEARELSSGADRASERSRQLRSQVEQSREMLRDGKDEVERMARRSDLATARLLEFTEASHQFAEFVDLIKQFARRTNLLALNAAIEAARAGGEARGLGVLAGEIRKLANQAGEAAERVETTTDAVLGQIESVTLAVEETRQATRTVGGVVDRIDESLGRVTGAIGEADLWADRVSQVSSRVDVSLGRLAERLNEVATGFVDFADAMDELAVGMERQRASTEEIAAAVTNLNSSAWQLAGSAEMFAINRQVRTDDRQHTQGREEGGEEVVLVDPATD